VIVGIQRRRRYFGRPWADDPNAQEGARRTLVVVGAADKAAQYLAGAIAALIVVCVLTLWIIGFRKHRVGLITNTGFLIAALVIVVWTRSLEVAAVGAVAVLLWLAVLIKKRRG
jgi:hypothetical protein